MERNGKVEVVVVGVLYVVESEKVVVDNVVKYGGIGIFGGGG